MAGRRSDQDNVDPGQFSSPHGSDNKPDEHLRAAAKTAYAQTLVDEKESMIPRRGENPALADLRARRDAARAEEANDQADERASDAERTE
ncbi:MAG TPA: hypothetical protein VGD56_01710 [Gemmatirosa sp.]